MPAAVKPASLLPLRPRNARGRKAKLWRKGKREKNVNAAPPRSRSSIDVTSTIQDSRQRDGLEAMTAEQSLPVQSISSLDSDANALSLIIGEDLYDSDFTGYSKFETRRSREVPQSRSKEGLATPPSEGPRTLTQKYWPKNFREIVGQAVVVNALSTAIVKGKVAPVYLFLGPRGTGKTSTARVFAAGLNCEVLDSTRRPCGICRACGIMALNRSADVREIDAASNADLASMRAMMGSFTPVGRYKVFIVNGCDLLSTDIWNEFLKVFEEPPTNVVFILMTTDAEQIPATATSRCQKFLFSKVKEADIVTRLEILARKEGLDVEEGALELIAARSDGSLRDAAIVLDQLCPMDKHVSVALVREHFGLVPDTEILELIDYALSADTIKTIGTLRKMLASGVEPLSLVSQLEILITSILDGSCNVRQEACGNGFFSRNFSVQEKLRRLSNALKILSEVKKQLRVTTLTSDRATLLTAALLQFAPDRSFLPSEGNYSVTQSAFAPQSAGPASHQSLPISDLPSMDEPEFRTQLGSFAELGRQTPQAYVDSPQRHVSLDMENATSLSEQKVEEAWAREPQQQLAAEYVGETSEARCAPESIPMEYQVFQDEVLPELWKRVLWEITSRCLNHLLQSHGRLVAAGVATDGSCAVVELEFDTGRGKHKAERSWRSICLAFQAVLSTAVELRISLSDMPLEEAEAARISGTMTDMQAGPSASPKNIEIVTEDSNGDYSRRPGLSTTNREQEEIAYDGDSSLSEMQGAAPSRIHRRRGTKGRKHRHAAKALENDLCTQQSPGGITPRRLPPSRRRSVKRNPKPAKTVTQAKVPRDESATGSVERLHSCLKRATECMEAVQQMSARRFNNEQCQYLVDKLQVVLLNASAFLKLTQGKHHRLSSSEDMARHIEIFKILVALANEIKSFIQGCCKKGWIQAAMTLTNVSEHVASIGFNLELCRVAWSKECAASGRLSVDQVVGIHKVEIEVVKKKASEDWDNLIAKVVCGLTEKSFSSEENDLAAYLLQRLHKVEPIPHAASSGVSWWSALGNLFEWVKPLEKIGKGASSTVYKAMWLGTPVAKKTFPGQSNPGFKREAEILGGLCHPNITSMFCCAVEKNSCSIIMELMDEDLHDLMQGRCNTRFHNNSDESPPFTIFEAVDIMLQVGEGVNYLHNQLTPSIVHRDLKSSNILVKRVTQSDSENGYVHAKVTDFGLSKTKDSSTRHSHQTPNMGTNKWMAPEVIKFDVLSQGSTSRREEVPQYPHKSDVYSFAIVCYEILTGHEPFPNESPNIVKRRVLNGERPNLPDYCPLELKALIKECWNQEPIERPSFDVICLRLKHLKYLLMTGFSSNQRPLSTTEGPFQTATKDIPLQASRTVKPDLSKIQSTQRRDSRVDEAPLLDWARPHAFTSGYYPSYIAPIRLSQWQVLGRKVRTLISCNKQVPTSLKEFLGSMERF